MKKWLIRIVIAVVIVLVVGIIAVGLFLDKGIKKGVETYGPQLTKVSVKLESASVLLFSGAGKIKGLEVGNPEGYSAPTSIKLDSASLSLKPGSLLSDKVVIKSIVVESPDIYIAGMPNKNNLTKILDNLEEATGGGKDVTATKENGKPAKKLQVDEFVLTGVKVTYAPPGFSGQTFSIKVPDIKFTDLGTGPDGITAAELSKRAISEIVKEVGPILVQELGKLGKVDLEGAKESATKAVGDAAGKASETLKGVTDGIFKKK